ncbi:MAG: hypothetical protein ACI9W1_001385 [Candidatus Azotimanducaceae bacterium]
MRAAHSMDIICVRQARLAAKVLILCRAPMSDLYPGLIDCEQASNDYTKDKNKEVFSMSTVWLSGLVGLGLFLLVTIAYGAHRVEMAKLERIRVAGLHRDRFRNLQFILDVLPGKAIKGELPVLLARSMALHMEQVIELLGESADALDNLEHARRLQQKTAKGEVLVNKDFGGSFQAKLKSVRRAVKLLKEFILQQHRGGFLSKSVASQYIKSLQEINVAATVDGLLSQASHSLADGSKSTSLHYYQLALVEISKCRNIVLFTEQKKAAIEAIKRIKADQKAISEVTQELNQRLVKSIGQEPTGDDDGDFDMRQLL